MCGFLICAGVWVHVLPPFPGLMTRARDTGTIFDQTMHTNDMQILETLETVAAAFPWDTIEIQIDREPEGKCHFSFWLKANAKYGFNYEVATGDTVQEAAARLIEQQAGKRDPDRQRKEKIAELRKQIQQLQAVIVGLPPYRPNRELAQVNIPAAKVTVDI